jgi:hypothetical protein
MIDFVAETRSASDTARVCQVLAENTVANLAHLSDEDLRFLADYMRQGRDLAPFTGGGSAKRFCECLAATTVIRELHRRQERGKLEAAG